MENTEAVKFIETVFDLIGESHSISDLKNIKNKAEIKNRFFMDSETYPPIEFSISNDEIETLIKEKSINEDFSLNTSLAKSLKDPFSKLLYSLIWKQGDLKKIRHIVQGIRDVNIENKGKTDGLVFYQFGKYLTKSPGEPIIDQHVLRAFKIYLNRGDSDISMIRKASTVLEKDLPVISQYKKWLISDYLNDDLKKENDYTYHIDQILFAAGKMVKSKSGRGVFLAN